MFFWLFRVFFFVKNKKVQDLQYGHASGENVKMGVAQKNWSLYLEKSENDTRRILLVKSRIKLVSKIWR